MTIALALIASSLFGAGVALQQRPATEVPDRYAGRPGLLLRVAHEPLWLLGVVAEIAAFVIQVAALRHGSLVVVQPLITTSLLFTVGLASWWTHQTMTVREWIAVLAVAGGLGLFLAVASPSDQSSGEAPWSNWAVVFVTMLGALAALVGVGLRGSGRKRAALLGLAAGLGDAFMAVLTKAFARATEQGFGATFLSWIPYALCAAGLIAMLLTQTAYQTGQPKVAIPLITVTEPLVSCGIGVGLFGEAVHFDGIRGPVVVVAIGVMVAGLVSLSRAGTAEAVEPVPAP